MHRRKFLETAALLAGVAPTALSQARSAPTIFQNACMTLPYSAVSFERAITGIQKAGYKYVAWGVTHTDEKGIRREALAVDASPSEARVLAARCRTIGLEPVMMFSTVNFEEPHAADAYKRRIDQAHAAGINNIIVFGSVRGGSYADSIKSLKTAAPHAEGTNVKLLVKQHGGISATGQDCAKIISDVNHPSVKMCYDAGNVLDYESHDPIPDIQKCWQDIRAFAIKDHRNFPADQDCGAGFGEIDHYKLLLPVMRTGLTMPLAAENIFEPLNQRPTDPEQIDRLARRSREYLESVLSGLEKHLSASA